MMEFPKWSLCLLVWLVCCTYDIVSGDCTDVSGGQSMCFNLRCPEQPPRTCRDVSSDRPRQVVVLEDGLEVMCDTQTDGGGWIVIQRRTGSEMDFYRDWVDYKYGFGDINSTDFWFGLERIHHLTFYRRYELRVDIQFEGSDYHANYSSFRVLGETEKYRLQATGYSGTAGDSLAIHNGKAFSTKDRDNDEWPNSCAVSYHGAWWYAQCHYSNLNGLWGSTDYAKGLTWYATTGYYKSATFSEMKIRPIE